MWSVSEEARETAEAEDGFGRTEPAGTSEGPEDTESEGPEDTEAEGPEDTEAEHGSAESAGISSGLSEDSSLKSYCVSAEMRIPRFSARLMISSSVRPDGK